MAPLAADGLEKLLLGGFSAGLGVSLSVRPWTPHRGPIIVEVMSNSCDASAELFGVGRAFTCVEEVPGVWHLFGELDAAGVPELTDRLTSVDGDVILDCSGLTFIDSSGLALFVAVENQCRARDAKLAIVNPSRCVFRLLQVTGLTTLLGAQSARSAP